MIYTAGDNPCWIRVRTYSHHFRAATNNQQAYTQIDKALRFRHNQAGAQADLDKLAKELNWRVVDGGE